MVMADLRLARFLKNSIQSPTARRITVFAVGISLGGAIVYAGLALFQLNAGIRTDAGELLSIKPSLPVAIRVPAVGISADFETPLDLQSNGLMEVPKGYDTVAWYKHSPTPGEQGPSVVVGHVDSEKGPEVFQPLKDLKDGDLIEVERRDGSVAVFEVYRVSYHSKKRFPFEKVFGDVDGSEIRLITCGGLFDKNSMSYSHNLVAYGRFLHWKEKGTN